MGELERKNLDITMSRVFLDEMKKELEILHQEKERIDKTLDDSNDYLEIKKNKGKYIQYYKCSNCMKEGQNKIERVFLKKESIDLARRLAQKSFDKNIYEIIQNKIALIEELESYYVNNNEYELYGNLSEDRKRLIHSNYEDDETYIKRWRQMFLGGSQRDSFYERYPITTPYYTERGERVRSKSEKIIADKLAKEGIPYVYEPFTNLAKNGMRPDFSVLNIRLRKTFFGEHFGMMDVPEYAIKCVEKINKYNELGYEYGRNLLYTFETQEAGLDTLLLDRLINSYLK